MVKIPGQTPAHQGYRLSPAGRACGVRCRVTQGSRTRAVARCAGLRRRVAYPGARGLALGSRFRPLGELAPSCCIPRARGLALGYTLSPAGRACAVVLHTQGSRTRRRLHAVARRRLLTRAITESAGVVIEHPSDRLFVLS
jgi:hypothetical protein